MICRSAPKTVSKLPKNRIPPSLPRYCHAKGILFYGFGESLDRGVHMNVLKLALERRQQLLDEIDALDWFIGTGTGLLEQHASASKEMAIQMGPIVRVEKAAVQRLIIEEYRRKRDFAVGM